jgi:hypothetical protein
MSSILAHIHLEVSYHVIIFAYVESCTWDSCDGCSVTLYHPIDIKCFLELDDIIRNPPPKVLVTCRLHGDVGDNNE